MAEVIDKNLLLDYMDERYKAKRDIVPDNLAEGFLQMEKLIKEQPTTTEAEIRNKAINEFFDELQKYEKDDWLKLKMLSIYHIAEQLKEELS